MDNIISYKIHIKAYQYMLAWDYFKNICYIFNSMDKTIFNIYLDQSTSIPTTIVRNSFNEDTSRKSSLSESDELKKRYLILNII